MKITGMLALILIFAACSTTVDPVDWPGWKHS